MTESNKLIEIVFYVSLFVIIGLAVTFTILFTLYSLYKRKNIKHGHEDRALLDSIRNKYKEELYSILQDKEHDRNSVHYSEIEEKIAKLPPVIDFEDELEFEEELGIDETERRKTLHQIIERDDVKTKKRKRFTRIFSAFLYVILFAFIGIIILFKANNDNFYIGNTTYLVIQTGSMETANKYNDYIEKNNLTNQIEQFSMIGIDKVKTEDIQLYDVLAFKNSKNQTIVHRLIKINVTDGVYSFTFRGDANTGSDTDEIGVTADKIIGKYNGFQNYGLGVATTYFKSSAGIVAISSAVVFIFAFDISEDMIDKEYKRRSHIVAKDFGNHLKK